MTLQFLTDHLNNWLANYLTSPGDADTARTMMLDYIEHNPDYFTENPNASWPQVFDRAGGWSAIFARHNSD